MIFYIKSVKCDVKNTDASSDESPLNTAFRAFVISRDVRQTRMTHTPLDSQKCISHIQLKFT